LPAYQWRHKGDERLERHFLVEVGQILGASNQAQGL
jgi:hypothetical protein